MKHVYVQLWHCVDIIYSHCFSYRHLEEFKTVLVITDYYIFLICVLQNDAFKHLYNVSVQSEGSILNDP